MSTEAPVKLTHNEEIKAAIPTVAGTIAATLDDAGADHFSADDYEFLKFHGCYQQDDRDLRKTGKKYIMMVRSRIPGGVMTANQWRVFDDLSARYGNNTLRVTTRQTIQFHGILKSNLRAVIKAINESLLSTLAACGDVNRNVLAPPTPAYTQAREQVFAGLSPQSPWRLRRKPRPITPSGLTASNSISKNRRIKISWTRFTAKRICRGNSKWPLSFRR